MPSGVWMSIAAQCLLIVSGLEILVAEFCWTRPLPRFIGLMHPSTAIEVTGCTYILHLQKCKFGVKLNWQYLIISFYGTIHHQQ